MPSGVYFHKKLSEETKRKMSEARIGNSLHLRKGIARICRHCNKEYKAHSWEKKYCDNCTDLRKKMAQWSYGTHGKELESF